MATYNRSNVLRFAVESVLWQTFADWELWVVGDACTDDTEAVMSGFGDPRVNFVNLETNVGEQSGPNNQGFSRARGRLIAYLGHDDLWLADHLEAAVAGLEDTGADFVYTLGTQIEGDGSRRLSGSTVSGRWEPWAHVPTSCWLLRREVLEEVGPWRSALELHETPQEELMLRIHKAGKQMRLVPRLTVLKLRSASRELVYARREFKENEELADRIRTEPDFRERELTLLALRHASDQHAPRPLSSHLVRALKDLVRRSTIALGIHPYAVHNLIRFGKKGGGIDYLRRKRGLDPLRRP
jgi:glycosyltransferase involved in cell wall biosynthesis